MWFVDITVEMASPIKGTEKRKSKINMISTVSK